MPRLENWSVVTNATPYTAPELVKTNLQGTLASSHPDETLEVGRNVITSRIVSLDIEAGKAVTGSGTVYDLGEPKQEWLDWLEENNLKLSDYCKG